jgi:tetratricopeptide (TPR) repeat protein
LLAGGLLGLAAWSSWLWLRPLLRFVSDNAELIQGLQALAQLVLWVGAATTLVFGVRSRGGQQQGPTGTALPTPRQLPRDIAHFVDRDDQLAELTRLLNHHRAPETPVPVCTLAGAAGVGKTALALKVAHRVSRHYRDGQLHMRLRTPEGQPLDPTDVLAGFLRALNGEQAVIPASLHEREAAYRDRLHGRRILVVLDDVVSEEQVRPLLPGSGTCAVLTTSQQPLAGLSGRYLLEVPVLDREDAVELLRRIAGSERVASELEAAHKIVDLFGQLPLAVQIFGSKLDSTGWRLSTYVNQLTESNVLSQLTAGDQKVLASLRLSYEGQSEEEQAAFRFLSLMKAPSFPGWVTGPLLDIPTAKAGELLNDLVDAHLIECIGEDPLGQLRYRFHNLLFLFARERLDHEDASDARRAAVRRLGNRYRSLAERAGISLQPGALLADVGSQSGLVGLSAETSYGVERDPLAWFAIERDGLIAAVVLAHDEQEWSLCVRLAGALTAFFELTGSWDNWATTSELAVAAANQAKDPELLAFALQSRGELLRDQRRWKEARQHFDKCLELFEKLGDRHGEASIVRSIGSLHRDQGDWQGALLWYERGLVILNELGDRRGRAFIVHDVAAAHRNDGFWQIAIDGFRDCLQTFQELQERRGEASTWRGIGVAYRNLGRWPEAMECFDKALPIFEALGDRRGRARSLANRADVYQEQGKWSKGIADLETCRSLYQLLRDERLIADTLRRMSVLYRKKGDARRALRLLEDPRCLPKLSTLDEHRWEHYARHNLAEAYMALGEYGKARALFEECLPYFQGKRQGHHDTLWEAKTLHGLGLALSRGPSPDLRLARVHLEAARTIFEDLGAPEAPAVEQALARVDSAAGVSV